MILDLQSNTECPVAYYKLCQIHTGLALTIKDCQLTKNYFNSALTCETPEFTFLYCRCHCPQCIWCRTEREFSFSKVIFAGIRQQKAIDLRLISIAPYGKQMNISDLPSILTEGGHFGPGRLCVVGGYMLHFR